MDCHFHPRAAFALLLSLSFFPFAALSAQAKEEAATPREEKPSHFKFYGFIRNYLAVDTRNVTAGTHDLFFYMPADYSTDNEGNYTAQDLNAATNWRYLSLTTRLGVDILGYQIGRMQVTGRVETDFYSLSGTGASQVIPQMRLRLAYMQLGWEHVPLTLTLGQAWHPMAADMPHATNLEVGVPFSPFNRSPMARLDAKVGHFTFTGALLYLNQFLPTGPSGKSTEYYKYGFPEAYLGVSYASKAVTARLGVDATFIKPIRKEEVLVDGVKTDVPVHGLFTGVSPFAFFQYTTRSGIFQLRAKTILAQGGEHMNLLSGYGVSAYDAETHTYSYTPMRDWASFVSFSVGKKLQFLCMAGYMRLLGTTAPLWLESENAGIQLWINTAGGKDAVTVQGNVEEALRITPTLAWNIGKFTVSLEYNFTSARFGNPDVGRSATDGLYAEGHTVVNHRFLLMTKFTF